MSAELHNLQTRKNIGKAKGLLHSLVPRAQSFCFYDVERQCVWSSDGVQDYEIDYFVLKLPEDFLSAFEPGEADDEDVVKRSLESGRTLLVLPVIDEQRTPIGILITVFSRNAGQSAAFNPRLTANILRPALELIGERLFLEQRINQAEAQSTRIEKELRLVYEIDDKVHGASRSHVGLAQLVGQSGRFLNIAYSVLLIPSKRIRISATHSSWKSVNRKLVDRYLIDHMMPKLEGHRWPMVFNIPGISGVQAVADQAYQTLLSPLIDRHGNLEGVLAQLGRVQGGDFGKQERRFMAHIVRKVEYVIERSFDAMTGLMNRGGFETQLQESRKTLANSDTPHQLIYFDLDNLQLVNDSFGREAGDAVIVRFARMLEEGLPRSAVLSRLSGDEFCILLTNSTTEQALDLATTARERAAALRYLEGDKSLQVSMSIGIAEFNAENTNEGQALTTARMACEGAKDHGRDRIEVYDDQNQSVIRRYDDMQLVTEIQRAIDEDLFELMAQPIIAIRQSDSKAPRFEILLRMQGADGEYILTPALFSAAERYRLVPQIDRWVTSKTIARLNGYAELIEKTGANFSINLSGQSLGDDDILDFIDGELSGSGIAACNLGFEITESAAVSQLKKAQAFIDALRDRGSRISLDDFGAGLSSFAYLKNFSVDTLKIDGGFIRDITTNRISESMVLAITQVAKVMELETVAEFVETRDTRKLLADLGVDYAQGHEVGRPLSLDQTLAALDREDKKSIA